MKILILSLVVLFAGVQAHAQEWQSQQSGVSVPLLDVFFVDETTGWAVGEEGIILHTSDGGQNWSVQHEDANTMLDFNKVHFITPQRGFVVGGSFFGGGGALLHTSNGGEDWQHADSDGWQFLESVWFADAENGWAVGGESQNQFMLRTTDGGENWTVVEETPGNRPLLDVVFTSPEKGWTAGISGQVFNTTDGGESWSMTEIEDMETISAIYMLHDELGWMITQNGEIYKTTNGTSWEMHYDRIEAIGRDIVFVNETTGYAGVFSAIYNSEDGGESWDEQEFVGFNSIFGLHFHDASLGWAVGSNGYVAVFNGDPVSVEPENEIPLDISLEQNYPNPFNPTTQISFYLPESGEISLSVYDINGRLIERAASGTYPSGSHTVMFDAEHLSSGVYLYRLQTASVALTRKMVLIK